MPTQDTRNPYPMPDPMPEENKKPTEENYTIPARLQSLAYKEELERRALVETPVTQEEYSRGNVRDASGPCNYRVTIILNPQQRTYMETLALGLGYTLEHFIAQVVCNYVLRSQEAALRQLLGNEGYRASINGGLTSR